MSDKDIQKRCDEGTISFYLAIKLVDFIKDAGLEPKMIFNHLIYEYFTIDNIFQLNLAQYRFVYKNIINTLGGRWPEIKNHYVDLFCKYERIIFLSRKFIKEEMLSDEEGSELDKLNSELFPTYPQNP